MRNLWLVSIWLLLSGFFALPAQAEPRRENLDIRVSAVIVGDGKQLAIVAIDDRSQELVRPGDMIGDYEIDQIDKDGVLLSSVVGKVFIPLKGAPESLADTVAYVRAGQMDVSNGASSHEVNYGTARRKLARLIHDRNQNTSTSTNGRQSRALQNEKSLKEQLNSALGLPPATEISEIDRVSFRRTEDALDLLLQKVQSGDSIRLTVNDSIAGVDTVYLSPLPMTPYDLVD